jgi:hypothetical protein
MAMLAFLAIAIQSFVVQTHIHVHFDWDALASIAHGLTLDRTAASEPAQLPSSSDVNCPVCQQQAANGHAALFDAAQLAPANFAVLFVHVAEALSASFVIVSHSWQGRAPPAL